MPIEGHVPWWNRRFLPLLCVPCRSGDHRNCRPFVVRNVLHYCECLSAGCITGPVVPSPRQEPR